MQPVRLIPERHYFWGRSSEPRGVETNNLLSFRLEDMLKSGKKEEEFLGNVFYFIAVCKLSKFREHEVLRNTRK